MLGFLYSASMPMCSISVPTCLRPIVMAFPSEHVAQHPAAGKWMLQVQLVDPAHQRQVRFADLLGR